MGTIVDTSGVDEAVVTRGVGSELRLNRSNTPIKMKSSELKAKRAALAPNLYKARAYVFSCIILWEGSVPPLDR